MLPLPLLSMHPFMQNAYSVPLGIAAEREHTKTVERLVKELTNINYQDKVRSTLSVRMQYIKHNHQVTVKTLILALFAPFTSTICILKRNRDRYIPAHAQCLVALYHLDVFILAIRAMDM